MACTFVLATAPLAHGQRQVGPRVADARQPQGSQRPQGAPDWFPLHPALQKHTDEVLAYWEHHSGAIERYKCDFQRWEYDRQNFDPKEAQTYAEGEIKYASPDKGLFAVTKLLLGKRKADGTIGYAEQKTTEFEKWICDGKTVFEFDHRNRQLIERGLPPEMQGKQIVDGPLPFLFGAKKAQIEARYWIRINPNPPEKNVFWLEAAPKQREDAANFKQVAIVIPDDKKFLPKTIILYHRGGTQTTFAFTNQQFNWNDALANLAIWNRAFFNPATPGGWKRVKEPAPRQQAVQPPAQGAPIRQAQQGLQRRPPR